MTRERVLSWLYGELRAAKISLGRAEGKPGVTAQELENLQNKVDVIDWLIPNVITGFKAGKDGERNTILDQVGGLKDGSKKKKPTPGKGVFESIPGHQKTD